MGPPSEARGRLPVLMFYCCLLLLLSSGRVASDDAGNQLQAAMLLAGTGHLGAKTVPGGTPGLWVPNSTGFYYEAHDVGNVVLMYPAAWLGTHSSHAAVEEKIEHPPIVSRLAASLTYSLFSAAGCFFIYRLFTLFYPASASFALSLAFLTTTYFWAYTKSAWDVQGGAVGMCITLYCAGKLITSRTVTWVDTALAAVSLAVAASFRYSLLPFVGLAVLWCFFVVRRKLNAAQYLSAGVAFLAAMSPALVYNYVRMGSPFLPATTAKQFAATTGSLTGDGLLGLYGLMISPNKGLLEFNPVLVVLVLVPFLWMRIPAQVRKLLLPFGVASALYILAIARVPGWFSFGWGPRYLVPILPVLFLIAAPCLIHLWRTRRKLLIVLMVVSGLLNAAPVLINWPLATSESPGAILPFAALPYQQLAVWHGLLLGLEGKPLPAPAAMLADPIRSGGARFPDIWTFRLMEYSRAGLLGGLAILLSLLGGVILTGAAILRRLNIRVA